MVAKLNVIKAELHTGSTIVRVRPAYGFGRLCSAVTNTMRIFRRRVCRLWRSVLVRRSQRAQVGWDRLNPLLDRWIPAPRVLHPYPDKRFDAIHPR